MSRPEDRTVIVSPKQPVRATARPAGTRPPARPAVRPRSAVRGGLWLAIAIGCGFGASFALTLRLSRPTFNPVAKILQSEQEFPEVTFPGKTYQDLESRYGAVSLPPEVETWSEPPSTAIAPDLPADPSLFETLPESEAPIGTEAESAEPPLSAAEPSWTPEPAEPAAPVAPIAPEPTAPSPVAPPLP